MHQMHQMHQKPEAGLDHGSCGVGPPPLELGGSLGGAVGQVVLDEEEEHGEHEDGDGHEEDGGVDHGGALLLTGHTALAPTEEGWRRRGGGGVEDKDAGAKCTGRKTRKRLEIGIS